MARRARTEMEQARDTLLAAARRAFETRGYADFDGRRHRPDLRGAGAAAARAVREPQMKLLVPVAMSAVMLGCTSFGGDLNIRVTGTMPRSTAQQPAAQCQLGMVSINSGKVGATRSVTNEFSTTMMVVVGTKPAPYYFVADCDDGRRLRSGEIVIGGRGGYGNTHTCRSDGHRRSQQGAPGRRIVRAAKPYLYNARPRRSAQQLLGIHQLHVMHLVEVGLVIALVRCADDGQHARARRLPQHVNVSATQPWQRTAALGGDAVSTRHQHRLLGCTGSWQIISPVIHAAPSCWPPGIRG